MQPQTEIREAKACTELDRIREAMCKLVIGQGAVLDQIVDSFSRFMAGMTDKERRLLSMLFLGPTGVGKTETIRVLAEVIFGSRRAFTRVSCQEYSAHYNISKLLGSPPGYVGGEIRPLLGQENLERHFKTATEKNLGLISEGGILSKAFPPECERPLSILLFDEIEKAHPKLWNILLGIIEDGEVVLGNNEVVNFQNTIIICTSNVGSQAISDQISNGSMGFETNQGLPDLGRDVNKRALQAAKKVFPAEWLNRMDDIVPFNVLNDQDLLDILDILSRRASGRARSCNSPFILEFSTPAKELLVAKLENREWGARPLKRMMEKEIITPISNYICGGEIVPGSLVCVDVQEGSGEFTFDIVYGSGSEKEGNIIIPSSADESTGHIAIPDDGGAQEDLPKQKEMIGDTP